ncbi:MAG: helix-turn-helix transcriptional regulator [Oscillospiraceae bacterium]|nr:helix-turn-helix transcriptional regulator [Oscillospiraceae bacterium]
MLISDLKLIGTKLLAIRKKAGLTQSEVAELSGLSDRTYADIERGTVNMRMETALKICNALQITPNDIVSEENDLYALEEQQILEKLRNCSIHEQKTALKIISAYLDSLKQS